MRQTRRHRKKDNPEDSKGYSFTIKLPDLPQTDTRTNLLLAGGIVVVGLGIGAAIGTQIFFGTVSVLGLYMLAEQNPYVKLFIIKGNRLIDLAIFGLSIYAIANLGVTLAGSLAVAGVLYTGVLAPHYRRQHRRQRRKNDE